MLNTKYKLTSLEHYIVIESATSLEPCLAHLPDIRRLPPSSIRLINQWTPPSRFLQESSSAHLYITNIDFE